MLNEKENCFGYAYLWQCDLVIIGRPKQDQTTPEWLETSKEEGGIEVTQDTRPTPVRVELN